MSAVDAGMAFFIAPTLLGNPAAFQPSFKSG